MANAALDLSRPGVDFTVTEDRVDTVTINTKDSGAAAATWYALARPKRDSGTIVEWSVSKTGAGSSPNYPVVVTVDTTDMTPGAWVWGIFKDDVPFLGLGEVVVGGVVERV